MAFIGEDHQSEVKKILKDYGFHFDKNLPRTKTVTYKHQNDEKKKVFWYYTKGKFLFQGKGFSEPSFIPSDASELVNKLENLINPQNDEKRKTFESIETHLIRNSPGPSDTPKGEEIQKTDQCTTMGGKLMEVETKQFELVGENQVNNNRVKDCKRKATEEPEDPVDSIPFKKPREDEMLFKGKHHQPDVERIINTYGFYLNKTEESKVIFKNEENHTLSWFFTKGKFMIQGRGFSQPKSHNFSEVINMIENLKNQEKEDGKSKLLEGKETPLMKMEHLKDDNSFALAHNVGENLKNQEKEEEKSKLLERKVTNADRIKHEQLTDEQKDVWEYVLSGRNVFLTGPAGTGKSFVFKYFIQELADLHGEIAVAVTAPTGVAAININGMTIHSFSGVGLGEEEEEELFQKILTNSRARSNWSRTKVLMIDEVSMIGSELFTKLANIGGRLKALEGKSSLPFGGIQVILCGDFFQLPPVMLGSESVGGFAFSSPAWKELNVKTWQLTQVVRQNDPEFIGILNTVRRGNVNQSIINRLETCQLKQKPLPEDGIIPTKLMCTNKDVDAENHQQLKKLASEEFVLEARDKIFDSLGQYAEKQLREGIENKVQKNITVKLEAQVVLIRNIDVARKLVNGTRGVVVGFKEEDLKHNRETEDKISGPFLCPVIKWDCGITEPLHPRQFTYRNPLLGTICREQVPLRLAWALTVHKSQGITLSRAQIKVDNAFENGQVYVALSRCISLDGLWMTGASLSQRAVMAHPEVIEFYKQ